MRLVKNQNILIYILSQNFQVPSSLLYLEQPIQVLNEDEEYLFKPYRNYFRSNESCSTDIR